MNIFIFLVVFAAMLSVSTFVVIHELGKQLDEVSRVLSELDQDIDEIRDRPTLNDVWDTELASTIETLTSDDIVADTLSKMSEEQMDRLATKVEKLREKNE